VIVVPVAAAYVSLVRTKSRRILADTPVERVCRYCCQEAVGRRHLLRNRCHWRHPQKEDLERGNRPMELYPR
jgi:hypothetical protein